MLNRPSNRVVLFFLCILLFSGILIIPLTLAPPSVAWDINVTASLSVYSDVSVFGVNGGATANFDVSYDQIDPITPPVGVVSYFYYPGNPLSPVNLQK